MYGREHCIFDLYGTLVDIHTDEDAPGLWAALADFYREQGAGYEPDELRGSYLRLVREAEAQAAPPRRDAHEAHPEIQLGPVFRQLFREKGVEAEPAQAVQAGRRFRALFTEYLRLYDGAGELLTTLRRQGRRLWLLSNAQAVFTRWELERLGLTDCFDGIYLSSDYGVKKPDRRFFDLLLREQGIDPQAAVMIGNDGTCDILGAKAAGLASVYVHTNLSPDEPLPPADQILEGADMEKLRDILMA